MKKEILLFARYFSKQKKALLFYGCLGVFQALLLIPVPLLLRYLIDQSAHGDWKRIGSILALLFLLSILSIRIMMASRLGIIASVKQGIEELRMQLASKAIGIPHRLQWSEYKSQLKEIIVHDTERLDIASTVGFGQVLPACISALLLTAVLLAISPVLFVIVFCIFPACIAILIGARKKQTVLQENFRDSLAALEKRVAFIVESWDLVKAQTAEKTEEKSQRENFANAHRISSLLATQHIYLHAIQESMGILFGVLLLAFGFYFIHLGMLSLGQVVSFFAGFSLLRMQLASIFNGWPQVLHFAGSLHHIDQVLNMRYDTPYHGTAKHRLQGEISLHDITVAGTVRNILDAVSATFEAQRIHCIMGDNGEGKTTLLLTMLGLLAPDKGEVRLDGIPLQKIDIRTYRKQAAAVFQHAFFLDANVQENMNYGLPTYGEEAPLGLDDFSPAHNRQAYSLSGGEKQKLMIGRALKRSPKILFLDEPTNHLDAKSRDRFLQHLADIRTRTTIICITHDPALIAMADTRFRLENARLQAI